MEATRTPATTAAPTPPLTLRRRLGWPSPESNIPKRALYLLVLAGLSVLFVYPFIWTISASLKPRPDVFDNRLIPQTWHPSNYTEVWDLAPISTWFLNSVYIGVLAALTVTL